MSKHKTLEIIPIFPPLLSEEAIIYLINTKTLSFHTFIFYSRFIYKFHPTFLGSLIDCQAKPNVYSSSMVIIVQ